MLEYGRIQALDPLHWSRLLRLCGLAYQELACPVRGPDGGGPPILAAQLLAINGSKNGQIKSSSARHRLGNESRTARYQDQSHEPLIVHREYPVSSRVLPGLYYEQVETGNKPYTIAVVATLLTLRHVYRFDSKILATDTPLATWLAVLAAIAPATGIAAPPPELADAACASGRVRGRHGSGETWSTPITWRASPAARARPNAHWRTSTWPAAPQSRTENQHGNR